MATGSRRRVYRVRNLPNYADRHAAAQLIAQAIAIDGSTLSIGVTVHSLAKAVDPWERVATQTATVTFGDEPNLGTKPTQRPEEWKLLVPGLRNPLILDAHFEGFTPLNDPDATGHLYE